MLAGPGRFRDFTFKQDPVSNNSQDIFSASAGKDVLKNEDSPELSLGLGVEKASFGFKKDPIKQKIEVE
jgi:hypothetical protein